MDLRLGKNVVSDFLIWANYLNHFAEKSF